MSEKYIGVFDSGLGGLTVVKAIKDIYPKENIVFFADEMNMPYGSKEREEIIKLSHNNIDFLSKFDLKAIVVACNTSDSVALNNLQNEYKLPIFGVIEPAIDTALNQSDNKIIGLLATPLTVKMGKYERLIKEKDEEAILYSTPCKDLASLVEEGIFINDEEKTDIVLNFYLEPLINKGIDTIILGCTHYDVFIPFIERLYPELNVVSSSRCVLNNLDEIIDTNKKAEGNLLCYTNASADEFVSKASMIINNIKVMSVD